MKNQRILGMVVAAVMIGAGSAVAQQPAERVTFNQAIEIALRQNLTIKQAENNVELQSIGISQAGQSFRPNLNFSFGGSNAVGQQFNQDLARLTTENTQSLNTSLSTGLTVFDWGRTRANVRSARASTDASTRDLTRTRQTAVFSVARDFVALVSAQSQLDVQRENLSSLQLQEAQIQRFADAGARPISDLYQVKATVANAQLQVTQAERSVEVAKINLIQSLELDPAKEYDFVAPVIPENMPTRTYRLDSLVAVAYMRRPDITANEARVAAANEDVRAAAAGRRPSLSLNASYGTGFTSQSDSTIFTQFNQRRGGSFGAGIQIPIFDRGSARMAHQRATISEEAAQLALKKQKQTVALEVRTAWLDVRSAQQQLIAATAGLTAATQALDAVQQRYNVGAATLLEVTQARAQRVTAASSLATARYNLVLTQAVIAYYTGELDPMNVSLGM